MHLELLLSKECVSIVLWSKKFRTNKNNLRKRRRGLHLVKAEKSEPKVEDVGQPNRSALKLNINNNENAETDVESRVDGSPFK